MWFKCFSNNFKKAFFFTFVYNSGVLNHYWLALYSLQVQQVQQHSQSPCFGNLLCHERFAILSVGWYSAIRQSIYWSPGPWPIQARESDVGWICSDHAAYMRPETLDRMLWGLSSLKFDYYLFQAFLFLLTVSIKAVPEPELSWGVFESPCNPKWNEILYHRKHTELEVG